MGLGLVAGGILGTVPGVAAELRTSAMGQLLAHGAALGYGLGALGGGLALGIGVAGRPQAWRPWFALAVAAGLAWVASAALHAPVGGRAEVVLAWLAVCGASSGLLLGSLDGRALGAATAATWLALWWATGRQLGAAAGPVAAALAAVGALGMYRVLAAPAGLPGERRRPGLALALGVLALAAAARLHWPCPVALSPASHHPLGAAGAVAAAYQRGEQELQLWRGTQRIVGEGPQRPQAELLATCIGAWAPRGARVLVFGLGTGRLVPLLPVAAPDRLVDAIDWDAGAAALRARLAADGPVPGLPPRVEWLAMHCAAGPRQALAGLRSASRDVLVLGEPLHDGADWQLEVDTQQRLRAAVGAGLVLQPLALDRIRPARLEALLAAAAAAHPWNAVFAVGDTAVLCSAGAPLDRSALQDEAAEAFASWSDAARWLAHRAHLGGPADLWRACLGAVRVAKAAAGPTVEGAAATAAAGAVAPSDDPEACRSGNLGMLADWLAPLERSALDVPGRRGRSLFAHWQGWQTELQLATRRLRGLAGPMAATAAQAEAVRFLPLGAPLAGLQAALGLPDPSGLHLVDPAIASRRAHAIDPTFFDRLAPVFAGLPVPVAAAGALEDLAVLPEPAELARWCSGDDDRAVALRARFRSACAAALVAALARTPLAAAAAAALRELVDPFVIERIAAACAARGAPCEVLGYWRHDLALPAAIAALWHAGVEAQCRLVAAAVGRRDPGSVALVAQGMLADDPAVRQATAVAFGFCPEAEAAVGYDPTAPIGLRMAAADRWRSLHNRRP